MKVTLEIPDEMIDELARQMGNPTQAAVEALASKGYEKGVLSLEQVRQLLGLKSRWEAQNILMTCGSWPGTTTDDFESDMKALESPRTSRTPC